MIWALIVSKAGETPPPREETLKEKPRNERSEAHAYTQPALFLFKRPLLVKVFSDLPNSDSFLEDGGQPEQTCSLAYTRRNVPGSC